MGADDKSRCCAYLRKCHNDKDGGFSGAPGLMSHLASTYAAVLAIVNIGTQEAYDIIDRPKMRQFLLSLKNNTDTHLEQTQEHNSWCYQDK
jgi:prenyltransferase beta subunit